MGTPLGDFIRAKRDATLPEELGLPSGERRRVPGLRRSELAIRSGVSVEYLTRIEQGRDRNPTRPVLSAIADGLGLNPAERRHLSYLAKLASGVCLSQERQDPAPRPPAPWPPAVETLRLLEPAGVAMLTNRLGDLLGHTSAFERLMHPSGLFEEAQPNLTRYIFTHPRAKRFLKNWEQIAAVAAFDLWHAPTLAASEGLSAQIAPLAGADFTAWAGQQIPPVEEPWQLVQADGTLSHWRREVLEISAEPDQQIVVLIAQSSS